MAEGSTAHNSPGETGGGGKERVRVFLEVFGIVDELGTTSPYAMSLYVIPLLAPAPRYGDTSAGSPKKVPGAKRAVSLVSPPKILP